MKQILVVLSSVLALLILTAFSVTDSTTATSGDYDYLRERLKNTTQYSVEVIEAMPEEHFDYKPTPDVLSFREQAVHIAYAIEWNILLMQKKPVDWVPGNRLKMSQAELSTYAREQFVHFENFVDTSKVNPVFTEQIVDVLSHNAHHRGQMTTYLRLKGIKPPAYR